VPVLILIAWAATTLLGVALFLLIRPPLMPWLPHAVLATVGLIVWAFVAFDEDTWDGAAPRFGLGLVLAVAVLGVAVYRQRRDHDTGRPPARHVPAALTAAHGVAAVTTAVLTVIAFVRTVDDWINDVPDLGALWAALVAGWLCVGALVTLAWRLLSPPRMSPVAQAALGAAAGLLTGAIAIFLVGTRPWLSLLAAALGGVFVGWWTLLTQIPGQQPEAPSSPSSSERAA
jgi:hypothetical protein